MQFLVLITKWSPIQTIIDIGEEAATFKRRPNRLHVARVEGVIKYIMLHLEPFKWCIKVTILVCLKDLIVAHMTIVAFAGNTHFG